MTKSFNKHSNFFMSDRLSPAIIVMMAREHPSSIGVYNALKSIADDDNVCCCTEADIRSRTKYSIRTISRAIKYMIGKGIIYTITLNNQRFYILNIRVFFHTVMTNSNDINGRLHFKSPVEICKSDDSAFFSKYHRYLRKARAEKLQSGLSSQDVINAYANKYVKNKDERDNTSKHYEQYIRGYLLSKACNLNLSRSFLKVARYLIRKLPIDNSMLNITNKDVFHHLKDVSRITTSRAIAHLKGVGFLLHTRGKMAIGPQLLSNAKRSATHSAEKDDQSKYLKDDDNWVMNHSDGYRFDLKHQSDIKNIKFDNKKELPRK